MGVAEPAGCGARGAACREQRVKTSTITHHLARSQSCRRRTDDAIASRRSYHDSDQMAAKLLMALASVASALKMPLHCLNVQLCIKPERRDEFLATIKANQAGTLSKEPLAVTYLFGEDENTPNTFHFFEQYEGRAGFEAHTQAVSRAITMLANWMRRCTSAVALPATERRLPKCFSETFNGSTRPL